MRDQLSSSDKELFYKSLIEVYVDKTQNPRFIERHWLKEQVEEQLADPNCRFLLLTAEPGAGKSAFIAWLAHLYPNWGRYFIRRDQRTPLGDVGAHSLLLQIGFQLAAIYPDLFNQEQIEITVRQRIGQASNSEIVGAEIQRIVASPFRRKIIDIQQEVRENRKTEVTGIQIGEIYSDVRLVPVDDLQYMALLDPAIALARTNPAQQIVVLVDALDELSYRDINGTLIHWLATCPELPPNVRFILTARPNTPELEHFCETKRDQIQKLSIQEKDPRVIADSLNYVKQWVDSTPRIQTALQTKGHEIEPFVKQAAEKADGNLGYLEAIARAVDQADDEQIAQFLDLSSLPQELEDLYGFFLGKIKNAVSKTTIWNPNTDDFFMWETIWEDLYQPILGTLSVALEPLTASQIQKFSAVSEKYLGNAIEHLCQFLDKLDNCYRLYHSTLPKFLTSEKARVAYDYCYIEPVGQNQRVIRRYKGIAESWQEANLEEIDDYGFRHLTQHLVQANLQQELHELLNLDKGGLNAWFEIKDSSGDVAGFLADVALAWSQAEGEFETSKKGELLGLQYRYALITASTSNLTANIPSALLAVLVKEGQWSSERALAYAQQIPDSYQKAKALKELAPYLTEQFRAQAYKAALKIGRWLHKEILTDMIQYSPKTLLEILPSIESVELQSKTWRNLASCISSSLLQDAFGVIQEVEANDELRAIALTALATRLPELIPQALKALPRIEDDQNRLQSLISLIPYSQDGQLSETFEIAREFLATDSQIKTLATFIIRLPKLLHVVIKKIQAKTQSKKPDAEFLTLFSDLPDVLFGVLSELSEAIWEIQTDENFAHLLIAIIPKLPETSMGAAFTATQAINDGEYKLRVLSVLIPELTGDSLLEAVQIVISIGGASDFESVILNSLCLPDNLVMEILKAIADYDRIKLEQRLLFSEQSEFFCKAFTKLEREQIFHSLIVRIPDALLQETIELVATFEQYKVRREILTALAPRLSDDLRLQAYKVINKIQDKDKQDAISIEESFLTPELLEAEQTIQSIGVEGAALASLIPDSLLIRSIESALISDEYKIQNKVNILIALAPRLPDVLLLQAYRVANGTQSGDIQNTLFSEMTDSSMRKILKEVQAIQEEKLQVIALKHLIPFLPTPLLSEALEVIKSLRVGPRLETIVRFFTKGQVVAGFEGFFKAFKNSINWSVDNWDAEPWTQVLTTVFPRLSNELWEDVFDEVEKVASPSKQLWVLFSLAPYMPKTLLPKVVKLARKAIPVGMGHHTTSFVVSFTAQFLDVAPDVFETELEYYSRFGSEGIDTRRISGILLLLPASLLPASFKATKSIFSSNNNSIEDLKQSVSCYLYKVFMPEILEAPLAIQNRMEQDRVFDQLAPQAACYLAPQAAIHFSDSWKDSIRLFLNQRDKKHLDISIMELLKALRAIQDEPEQVEALKALASYCPNAQLASLKTAVEIQSKKLRETVLRDLIESTPTNLLPEALITILETRNKTCQDQTVGLSFEIYLKALQSIIRAKSGYQFGVLLQLAPKLGDTLRILLKKSFSQIRTAQSQLHSEKPYLVLARILTASFAYLLTLVFGMGIIIYFIVDKLGKAKNSLFYYLSNSLPLLLRSFIPESYLRNYLGNIYVDLEERKFKLTDCWRADSTLENIAPYLTPIFLPHAWLIAGVMPDDMARSRALGILLPYLHSTHIPLALNLIRKIESGRLRREGFCELVDAVSPMSDSLLQKLLEVIQTLKVPDYYERSSLDFQKELAQDAERNHIEAWIKLVPHLPTSRLKEAQEVAVNSTSENSITLLQEIALHLPFPEAMSIIQTFRRLEDKLKTLKRLAERFAREPSADSYVLWKTSLHLLVEHSHERKVLLTALEWLAPLIEDLGMQEGFAATLQGIQRVVAWYP